MGFITLRGTILSAENERYIVVFQAETPTEVQTAIITDSGGTLLHRLPLVNAIVMQIATSQAEAALRRLRSRPEVKDIEVDIQVSIQSRSRDEGASGEGADGRLIAPTAPASVDGGYTWSLLQIALDEVNPTIQGEGVVVAVLDTGIDASHPALAGVVVGGYNARAREDETDYMDRNGHGTHIAGIIAAQLLQDSEEGAGPMRGVAPGASLYAVRVLNDAGKGYMSDVINGLSWLYHHPELGIRVINISLGFYKKAPYNLLEQYVYLLHSAGTVLVVAAGNYRSDCIPASIASGEGADGEGADGEGARRGRACNTTVKFPARYPQTIAVAATDSENNIAYYSLRGPEVNVVAPGGAALVGERVLSTYTTDPVLGRPVGGDDDDDDDDDEGAQGIGGDDDDEGTQGEGADGTVSGDDWLYGWGSGTSQATAYVAGLGALLLSVNPQLTPDDVRTILQATAIDLGAPATAQGAGLIDAARAVEMALQW